MSGFNLGAGSWQVHFRTAFVRPERFRFETEGDRLGPWIVWTDGEAIRFRGGRGLFDKSSSLDHALSQLAFPSYGSSLTVPQLLLSKTLRTADLFSLITNPTLTGEEKIDGRNAYRIEGELWSRQISVWIDRAQYLLLKVSRRNYDRRSWRRDYHSI
jgi:hypothetical protein